MEAKLAAAVKKLLADNREMAARIERLEKVKPVVVNGKDGAPGRDAPTIDEVVEAVIAQIPTPKDGLSPDPKAIVNDVLAQMPKPRDGRDAPVVNVSDVASIVLAKMPKPKDGKSGRDAPDISTIVKSVKAQLATPERGEPGPQGKPGKPGKDGVSVTDVELKNNELFVSLDGRRKSVGRIKVPTPTAPFNPGNGGGGRSDFDTTNTRLNGRYFIDFVVDEDIVIPDQTTFNLFNSVNGILSPNGTRTFSGDPWDQPSIIDGEFVSPDTYQNTDSPFADVETSIFVNIPADIGGGQARKLTVELRRRTAASPTIPVEVPGRGIVKSINRNIDVISVERIPTRSSGPQDNYYVYGYAIYIVNDLGASVVIRSGAIVRVEVLNLYRTPIQLTQV